MSRIITVYSSQGKNGVEINTDVATFGALKPLLTQNGYKHDGMNCIISDTDNLLISDESQLLDGDFTLIMTPKKTKAGSGNRDRKTCYARIKEIVTANPDAKSHFTDGDKNHTQIKTDILNTMIDKWESKNKTATVSTVVESVKESKNTTQQEFPVLTVESAIAFLRSQNLDDVSEQDDLNIALDEVCVLLNVDESDTQPIQQEVAPVEPVESEEERLAREAREEADRIKKEKERLAQAKIDKYSSLRL